MISQHFWKYLYDLKGKMMEVRGRVLGTCVVVVRSGMMKELQRSIQSWSLETGDWAG